MKRKHRGVAKTSCRGPTSTHSKGMRRIINDLETVFGRHLRQGIDIAKVSVDMYGQDGAGLTVDERLDTVRVKRIGVGIDVGKDGNKSLSNDCVRCRSKGIRGRDDLSAAVRTKAERLENTLKSRMPVNEQRHIIYGQVLAESLLESLVLFPHVSQPMTLPQWSNLADILLKRGHRGPGDHNLIGHACSQHAHRSQASTAFSRRSVVFPAVLSSLQLDMIALRRAAEPQGQDTRLPSRQAEPRGTRAPVPKRGPFPCRTT